MKITRDRIAAVGLLAAAGIAAAVFTGRARAHAEPPPAGQTARNDISLTVYNEDFGMVREVRPEALAAGTNRMQLHDVSSLLDPQSVALRWAGAGSSLPQVTAQSYDLGVKSSDQLLRRYIGKQVEVVRYGQDGHEAERQKGALMAEAGGSAVVQSDGKLYVNPSGTIVAPASADIVTIPALAVQAQSPSAQSANLEVAYLTRGLAWSADYVATLSPGSDTLGLECWATVTNRTGAAYPGAKVTLVAGSPNRAVVAAADRAGHGVMAYEDASARSSDGDAYKRMKGGASFSGGMAPETVGDFHSYQIKDATTLEPEQLNRILVFSGTSVPVKRDYSIHTPALSSWYWYNDDALRTVHCDVGVALAFANGAASQLGVPLPHGAIRLYEPGAGGALQYIGASAVQDTAVDESVHITLARAFDLSGEWKVARREKIDRHTTRMHVVLTLHNEKSAPATIRVLQDFEGSWKIVSEPSKHVSLNSQQAQWSVTVPAASKTPFAYSVDLKY